MPGTESYTREVHRAIAEAARTWYPGLVAPLGAEWTGARRLVGGPRVPHDHVDQLGHRPADYFVVQSPLRTVRDELQAIDAGGLGSDVRRYRSLAASLPWPIDPVYADQRRQEHVLYDFLVRVYESRSARSRSNDDESPGASRVRP